MRKFLHILVMLVLASIGLNAQTLSVENVQANPGGNVFVPLKLDGYSNQIAAITIYLDYNPDLLKYVGGNKGQECDIHLSGGGWTINYSEVLSQLVVLYVNEDGGASHSEGSIIDLKFEYLGSATAPIEFVGTQEIANTNLSQTFFSTALGNVINGSVSPLANNNNVTLGTVQGESESLVLLPLSMEGAGFEQVDAFTYKLKYCYEKLDFVGLDNNELNGANVTYSHNSDNGEITLEWTNPTAQDFSSADPLFNLKFIYHGGDAPVKFMPGTEISNNGESIPYTPTNGMITLADAPVVLDIAEVQAVVGGQIEVPVVASGFVAPVGAFTLKINYDANKLSFNQVISNHDDITWTVNNSNGVLELQSNSSAAGFSINDGNLFTLVFTYNQVGTAAITFNEAGSNAATTTGANYPLNFDGGSVTETDGGNVNIISGGNWFDASNWSLGVVPTEYHEVIVNPGSEVVVSSSTLEQAIANSVTINANGQLTIASNNTLAVAEDFVIVSDATGNGSFINNGNLILPAGLKPTVQMYVTPAAWHGISASVKNQKAEALFLGHNPDVWIKEFNETTQNYEPTQGNMNTHLGDMKGWMMWLGGTEPHTFEFKGQMRSGIVVPTENLTRSGEGNFEEGFGANFVGNPFTSAIDWNATSGWTKENLSGAIFVYDPVQSNFRSYVTGVGGTNGGSQYVAMNQGFFVEVLPGQSEGILKATNAIQVHNNVPFYSPETGNNDMFKLTVIDGYMSDELLVAVNGNATADFDAQYDASKMFSFDENHPQIFALTSNDKKLSINSISNVEENISVDVTGIDGHMLTIKAIETEDFEDITLIDKFENVVIDIKNNNYEFVYDENTTDRFEIKFGPISNQPNLSIALANVYAQDNAIHVKSLNNKAFGVVVYNVLGQVIATEEDAFDYTQINVEQKGTYLVRVTEGTQTQVKKVVIK